MAVEPAGHLYARECAGNTWYAIGALHLRQGRRSEADSAFDEALRRVPLHPMARLGRRAVDTISPGTIEVTGHGVDVALARAGHLVISGAHVEAASGVEAALAEAPAGPSGWLLPLEPLLNVSARPEIWANALASLRNRAA